jgi:4-amino-4-deoxy-L-arabinose transferase-like glycosyltransferase
MVNPIPGISGVLCGLGSAVRSFDWLAFGGSSERPAGLRAWGWGAQIPQQPWIWMGLVVVLFCIPLFVGLGRVDLENDEAIYSFAVDGILESGNWLTPRAIPREDIAFLEKPPLKFWIVAAPIRLGLLPHNELGLRFWDAVFGSAAFLYVFAIGRRLGGSVCGVVAVLMLFVHEPLLFAHGLRTNNMEAALLLSYCGGVSHFLAWRAAESGTRRRLHVLAVGLYFVLAFMTKFVAALFLPSVLAVAILLRREDRARLARDWRAWLASGLLAAALIAPWFLYQYHQFGAELWTNMVGAHVYTRFTAYLDPAHLQPWHHYFTVMFEQLRLSQTLVITIAGAALVVLRTIRSGWPEGAAILLWLGLPLGLISLGTSKIYHYAYPFLPPVALMAGYAATCLVDVVWSLLDQYLWQVDRVLGRAVRRVVTLPASRVLLLFVAGAATVVALVTGAAGHVRLAVGGLVLFRNSSRFRPLLIALVALVLAGRLGTATRLIPPLALLAVLPLDAYRSELSRLPVEDHPLRSMRDCLQPLCARQGGPDRSGPGVWVEDEQLTWPYFYYLRRLGPWQQRDVASDQAVFMHLYVPSRLRPVLLSYSRFDEFTRRVRAGDPNLIRQAAREAGVDPSALAASARQTVVPFVGFQSEVLMLPGPYSACVPEQARKARR